jgi:hypothetical protein
MFHFYFANALPSVPDWIQAFAAVIAAIGVVWTLIRFKSDQQDIQAQINSLATIAKESDARLKSLYVNAKPFFRCITNDCYEYFPGGLNLRLQNCGGIASNLVIMKDGFKDAYCNDQITTVNANHFLKFTMLFNEPHPLSFEGVVKIKFDDSVGRQYMQEFYFIESKCIPKEPQFI